MKRKLILILGILMLGLTGCQSNNDTNAEVGGDISGVSSEEASADIEEVTVGEEEEGDVVPDWLVAADAIYLYDYGHEYLYEEHTYQEYLDTLSELKASADYYEYANNLYNQASSLCTNDEEKDFLECMIKYYFHCGKEKDAPDKISDSSYTVKKVWGVGYDDDGMVSSNLTAYHRYVNVRSIITEIETASGEIKYLDFIGYDLENADGSVSKFYTATSWSEKGLANYAGFDTATSSGTLEPEFSVLDEYQLARKGAEYYETNCEAYVQMVDDNYELWDMMRDYLDVFIEQKEIIAERKASREPVDPAIGMTKSQLENITWGSPSKKNVDEYDFGTYEQWVYPGKGYIYLEDGIVTSISYRR